MAVMLSIRNTDTTNSITVNAADYYDTKGKLVKKYYNAPVIVAPLESIRIYIPADDRSGGEGANFIVKWSAQGEVNVPIIESIMIGRDLSIVSPGQEIREPGK
jgi:5,10-methenyltetrahydromethanopterin hydrogenase